MEEWRQIPRSSYSASSEGRIRCDLTGRVGNPSSRKAGYSTARVDIDGVYKNHSIHRLIATAFFGPIPPGQIVNHIDGDKRNNTLSNLELCSYQENSRHALALGLLKPSRGEGHCCAKLSDDQVLEIRQIKQTGLWSSAYIASLFGVSNATVTNICNGRLRRDITKGNPVKLQPTIGSRKFEVSEQFRILELIKSGMPYRELRLLYPALSRSSYKGIRAGKMWKNLISIVGAR